MIDQSMPDDAMSSLVSGFTNFLPAGIQLAIELEGRLVVAPAGGAAQYTLKISSRATLARLLARPDIGAIAEAYVRGEWDLVGDLESAIRLTEEAIAAVDSNKMAAMLNLSSPPCCSSESMSRSNVEPAVRFLDQQSTGVDRAKRAISYHYDFPVEYWRLWLDDELLYTCGYYLNSDDDIHAAQRQKMARVAAKVRLRPGDRLLDMGCGWGGFTIHAARCGARVCGVTLSEPQAAETRRRIEDADLTSRCAVEISDFRDYRPTAPFDAGVALGLIEHLGADLYPAFFRGLNAALRPGGLLLVQAIAVTEGVAFGSSIDFIRDYVFPDAKLESIGTMLLHAERAGFEVRDVESLRDHYTLTLRQWLRRLEQSSEAACDLVGGPRYRAFRAYLAGFANEFRKSRLNVYQILLQRPGQESRLPLTRDHLSTDQ